MAMTYDYNTGGITRDWHIRRHDEKCRLSGLPAKVGGDRCSKCQYHKGTEFDWQARDLEDTFFTLCSHPEAKDSDNTENVLCRIYDRFESKALVHMYD